MGRQDVLSVLGLITNTPPQPDIPARSRPRFNGTNVSILSENQLHSDLKVCTAG